MTPAFAQILAETDSGAKLIIFLVVIGFWIVGAIIKSIKHVAEQQKLQERLRMTGSAAPPPPRLAPEIARRVPPMMPTRPPIPVRQTKAKPKRARQAPQPPTIVPPQVAQAAPPQEPAPVSPSVSASSLKTNASALRGWLRPETLQHQFILTEILQPPLALRAETP